VTGLHALLAEAAGAALARQRSDGSLPAGCNGPYADRETPLRNTGHWLVIFTWASRGRAQSPLRAAAEAALAYLVSEKARPGGASFLHRDGEQKDRCNGLVGQAWSIEALACAARELEYEPAAALAEQVFLLHPFDPALGLWRRVEVDGRVLGWDTTFNHQLWFAAAGALLAPQASPEVARRVTAFLDRLPRHLSLHRDGVVRHLLSPWGLGRRQPRYAVQHLRGSWRDAGALRPKEVGYHAFNLYALALLRRHTPDHRFWRHRKFARLWKAASAGSFLSELSRNAYGWPYNPSGFEMAFALEIFEGPGSRAEQECWLAQQLARHWDAEARALRRDTPDPETLAARLYEATRLPDLPLPAIAPAQPRVPGGPGR
jgi:hypothetical protein